MKKSVLFLSALLVCLFTQAQVKKRPLGSPVGTRTPAASSAMILKSENDSLSYAIGMMVAGFYKQQGITDINTSLVTQAMNDALKNGKPKIEQQQCQQVLMAYVEKQKSMKAAGAKKEGADFLAKNKTLDSVVTTTSGLQYKVITMGTGLKPADTSKVRCNYEGRLIDGTVFDSSDKQGHPVEFPVNGVIKGWTEALQLMPQGSKWRLFIPSDLAYGDNQMGPDIRPGSTLIFDVELVEIVK